MMLLGILTASALLNVVCLCLVFHYRLKDTAAIKKIEAIESELVLIEQQADRRIVPAILKVTEQIKSHL